jgi:hypothetical protein
MLTVAVFSAGLFAGAALGVFSLVVLECAACAITFIASWSAGLFGAFVNSMEMAVVLLAGFLVALVVSCLSPRLEHEAAHWLRRRNGARDRNFMHERQ